MLALKKPSITHDLDYRLTSFAVKNGAAFVSSLGYAYGDGMNLTAINDNVVPANTIGLWYNPANRLQNADGTWGQSVSYYDGVGNRTYDNTTVGAVTTTRASIFPSGSNRISGMTENGATLRTYTHDGGGNIITDVRPGENFAFTYNKRNRPASVTRNTLAYATYGYNAFEQLVTRSTSAVGGPVGTIHSIYDLDGHLIAEADAITGATSREYLWAAATPALGLDPGDNTPIDLPLAVIDGVNTATPATLWVHTDHLGRPTRMTDSTKATVWQAAYKPWGEPTLLSGTKLLNLRFPGQYFQIETGLAYNWNRHYDTTTGRYTQPDPLRFVDGPSVYAYAGNSPWMVTDRRGLDIAIVVGGPTGITGGPGQSGGGIGNPFGHVGIGITGRGTFSPGTNSAPGSSFTDYLNNQSQYRSSTIFTLKTSKETDQCVASVMSGQTSNLPSAPSFEALADNCSTRVSDALKKCGIDIPHTNLPGDFVPWALGRGIPYVNAPKGQSNAGFESFNPKK